MHAATIHDGVAKEVEGGADIHGVAQDVEREPSHRRIHENAKVVTCTYNSSVHKDTGII